MKNTYKESWDYIKLLVEDVIGDYSADGIEDDPICELDELVAQNTPPTWEEVVNAWEYCDYSEGYKVYQEGNVLRVYSGNELYFEADIRSLEWCWYGVWIDQLTHYAINITIRYLESQQ